MEPLTNARLGSLTKRWRREEGGCWRGRIKGPCTASLHADWRAGSQNTRQLRPLHTRKKDSALVGSSWAAGLAAPPGGRLVGAAVRKWTDRVVCGSRPPLAPPPTNGPAARCLGSNLPALFLFFPSRLAWQTKFTASGASVGRNYIPAAASCLLRFLALNILHGTGSGCLQSFLQPLRLFSSWGKQMWSGAEADKVRSELCAPRIRVARVSPTTVPCPH